MEMHSNISSKSIQKLKDENEKLTTLLTTLQTEENEVQSQLESLCYAVELTRDEMHRRQRANNAIRNAKQLLPSENDKIYLNGKLSTKVQQLEAQLLQAKTKEADLVYQVEKLEFQLKTHTNSSNPLTSPTSSTNIDLPQLNDPPSRPGSLRNSPAPRALRLIGDIDIILIPQYTSTTKQYIPCRLGLSSGRYAAIYSYASSTPVATIDNNSISISDLDQSDTYHLYSLLESVDVRLSNQYAEICGFKEPIHSLVQLLKETGTSGSVHNEIEPAS